MPCSSDIGFAMILVAIGAMVALVKIGHGLKVYWIAKARALDPNISQVTSTT